MTSSALSKGKRVLAFATLALGMGLSVSSDLTSAAQGSGQFTVTATLAAGGTPALPKSTFCQTTPSLAFGAIVTVVCATGEVVSVEPQAGAAPGVPTLGRAYQVVLSRTFSLGLPDFTDSSAGFGVASSWRVIQMGDRNYYELLMGW